MKEFYVIVKPPPDNSGDIVLEKDCIFSDKEVAEAWQEYIGSGLLLRLPLIKEKP